MGNSYAERLCGARDNMLAAIEAFNHLSSGGAEEIIRLSRETRQMLEEVEEHCDRIVRGVIS